MLPVDNSKLLTVGELVTWLLQFDSALPILKSDFGAVYYSPIVLYPVAVFSVIRVGTDEKSALAVYADAAEGTEALQTVIL